MTSNQLVPQITLNQRGAIDRVSVIDDLRQAVDETSFYHIADSLLNESQDPAILASCAGLVSHREPGGYYFRAKFWGKTLDLISDEGDEQQQKQRFGRLCAEVGVHPIVAAKYAKMGEAINAAEATAEFRLYSAPSAIFQNAANQKENARHYLIEAAKRMKLNASYTPTQIHIRWCQQYGSRAVNLDIIKPSDWWAFGHPKWPQLDDFPGSIPGEVYANALYYFAPKRGVAVDPMAGSGMLMRVYNDRERWQKDSNFDLEIRLFDLYPCYDFISRHDAREPLPTKADWVFLDPPYFGQSKQLYNGEMALTKSYEQYYYMLEQIILAMAASLNPNGRLCLLLPRWKGSGTSEPNRNIPSDGYEISLRAGLRWLDTAFVSRAQQRVPNGSINNVVAKRERRMLSDTCVLNIFESPVEVR